MRTKWCCIGIMMMGLTAASATRVDALAGMMADPGNGGPLRDDYTAVGFKFTVGSRSLDVFGVGVWDYQQNGAAPYVIPVSFFDVTASTNTFYFVPASGATSVGEFRYVSVTPFTLLAGHDYVLQAQYTPNGGEFWHNAGSFALTTDAVGGLDARFGGAAGVSAGPGAFLGPNLLIPEPVGLAVVFPIVGMLRRRRV